MRNKRPSSSGPPTKALLGSLAGRISHRRVVQGSWEAPVPGTSYQEPQSKLDGGTNGSISLGVERALWIRNLSNRPRCWEATETY